MLGIKTFLIVSVAVLLSASQSWADGRWLQKPPMDGARSMMSAATLNGEIYIAGGDSITGPVSSFDVYDPSIDFWRSLMPMPSGRALFGMVGLNGRLYLSGGYEDKDRTPTFDLWVFDPSSSSWIGKAPMPVARADHKMVAIGDEIYVIGGFGTAPEDVYIYNTVTDKWRRAPGQLPVPRNAHGVAFHNGAIYVIGGRSADGKELRRVDRYWPKTATWDRGADLPAARAGLTANVVAGRIHAAGGATPLPARTYGEHYSYNSKVNQWRKEPSLLTPRHSAASATVDGVWYVFGGGSGAGFFTMFTQADVVEAFIPES